MKNSINVYWAVEEFRNPSLPLLVTSPEPVVSNFAKNNKNNEYIKCPSFAREFNNTFLFRAPHDFRLNIDPNNMSLSPEYQPFVSCRNPQTKQYSSTLPQTILFSDESLEMSQIPSSLHFNDFINNINLFPGRYNIGKWFRPLSMDFILKTPNIKIKKDDTLFYLKFHTDKKINFINFKYSESIDQIKESCLNLKFTQPGYGLKAIYDRFTRAGHHKRLLKEIKKNITDLK